MTFIRTLKLDDEHAITPENSHLFAAIGSALNYKEAKQFAITDDYEQNCLPIFIWNLK